MGWFMQAGLMPAKAPGGLVCVCMCAWECVCVIIVCVPLVSEHVPQHSYAFIYCLSVIRGLEVLVVLCVRARVCV